MKRKTYKDTTQYKHLAEGVVNYRNKLLQSIIMYKAICRVIYKEGPYSVTKQISTLETYYMVSDGIYVFTTRECPELTLEAIQAEMEEYKFMRREKIREDSE